MTANSSGPWARNADLLYGTASPTDADLVDGVAAWSIVHGLATLWLDGNVPSRLGSDPAAVARTVAARLRADAVTPAARRVWYRTVASPSNCHAALARCRRRVVAAACSAALAGSAARIDRGSASVATTTTSSAAVTTTTASAAATTTTPVATSSTGATSTTVAPATPGSSCPAAATCCSRAGAWSRSTATPATATSVCSASSRSMPLATGRRRRHRVRRARR